MNAHTPWPWPLLYGDEAAFYCIGSWVNRPGTCGEHRAAGRVARLRITVAGSVGQIRMLRLLVGVGALELRAHRSRWRLEGTPACLLLVNALTLAGVDVDAMVRSAPRQLHIELEQQELCPLPRCPASAASSVSDYCAWHTRMAAALASSPALARERRGCTCPASGGSRRGRRLCRACEDCLSDLQTELWSLEPHRWSSAVRTIARAVAGGS